MRLFGLRNCDATKAAIKALSAAGMRFEVVDMRQDGLSGAAITAMLAALGPEVINRRSATWRALGEAERAAPAAELLARHPLLMKRPVIESPAGWSMGWSPKVQAQHLA